MWNGARLMKMQTPLKNMRDTVRSQTARALSIISLAAFAFTANQTFAAASAGCEGGSFSVLGISGNVKTTVPAANVPSTFLVKGKYVEFTMDAATFGVLN